MATPPPSAEPNHETLAGLVERVTFHNADNGFCVLRVKARSHRDLVTLVGHAATISAGEWITALGELINDHTHGQRFKARFLRASAPSVSAASPPPGPSRSRDLGPPCGVSGRLAEALDRDRHTSGDRGQRLPGQLDRGFRDLVGLGRGLLEGRPGEGVLQRDRFWE